MALNFTGMVRSRIQWRVELDRKKCLSARESGRKVVEYVTAVDQDEVRKLISGMSHLAAFRITSIREQR